MDGGCGLKPAAKLRIALGACGLFAVAVVLLFILAMRQDAPQQQLIGTWQSSTASYMRSMQISYSKPDYTVSLYLQTESCGGSVDGLAHYNETQKELILTSPAANEEVCTIRIHIQSQHATILESSACLYHHGVACNFEGRLEKAPTYFLNLSAAAKMIGL